MPLVAIAQCFAMACAVDASFPELNGACLGALTPSAIDQIDSYLRFGPQGSFQSVEQNAILMQFPRHMTQRFPQQTASTEFLPFTQSVQASSGSPFVLDGIDIHSAPGTPPYPPNMQYMESPNMSELSMPPSPYLASYGAVSSGSHRHSAQFSGTPRPGSIYSDRGSLSVPPTHDSPRFSPSFSPQPDPVGYFPYGSDAGDSPAASSFSTGLVTSEIWV